MNEEIQKRLLRDSLTSCIKFSLSQGSTAPVIRENILIELYRYRLYRNKLIFIAKSGWPVEMLRGRPIINLIRIILHTKKIQRYEKYYQETGRQIIFTS